MVVIVIIGLLATAVMPHLMGNIDTANRSRVKADVTTVSSAVQQYAIMNGGRHPAGIEILVTPDENGARFLDLDVVPLDPWKHPYVYVEPQGMEPFLVWSYGRDGEVGGEGPDLDINHRMVRNGDV